MRANLFIAANLLIALDYLLIGVMFARQIRLPRGSKRENVKALLAYIALATFFLLCSLHTHILGQVYITWIGEAPDHWLTTRDIVFHFFQGAAGMAFWYLARKHLHITITDRKTYDKANDPEAEQRLQYLAARAGLR